MYVSVGVAFLGLEDRFAACVMDPFRYGADGAPQDRKVVSKQVERAIMRFAPDVILVHVKAAPEVIARRIKEHPHQNPVLKEKDIASVLKLFEDACARTSLRTKITLDTSTAPVQATIAEFARKIERYLTDTDRLRILTHRAVKSG